MLLTLIILGQLFQMEEQEEIVWASALSCLFYFVCDGGKFLRSRLDGLDIRVRNYFNELLPVKCNVKHLNVHIM